MKFNFFFVHGWGFDSSFWGLVGNVIKEKKYFNSLQYINLGFINKKDFPKKTQSQNSVFIVHSYGLNWFLKKKIKCRVLIIFFAAPNFVRFQKNPFLKKRLLNQMIERFHQYPEEVITNFYKNSGLKTKLKNNFKKVNYRNLLNALDELLNDDLQVEFDDLDCNIFSVFSLKDRIFKPSLDRIKELKCKKHTIKLLDVNNHAMPRIEPKKTFDLIDGFLRSLERKDCEKKN